MPTDRQGIELSAASDAAAGHFDEAVGQFLGYRREPVEHLKRALAADPGFVMGHCLRGAFYLLLGNAALKPRAARSLAAAEAGAAHATPRERAHVEALSAWCGDDLEGAVRRWEAILLDHPLDVLALRLAYFTYLDLGDSRNLRDSVARVLPAWDSGRPGYGHLLGMHAFGLEECGDCAAAERAGRRAVEIDASDIWGVHAVAHVMETQSRPREGIGWLGELEPGWTRCNFFTHHVWWHRALYHIELGEHDAALALYDTRVRDDDSDLALDMANAASLLWRLELNGVAVGGRWGELADKSARRIDDHVLPFSDAHFMMALAAGGRGEAAGALLASMRDYAATRQATTAPVMRAVGIPLCEALGAFRAGDCERTVELLHPLRYELYRIGGSHAQRDVFGQTLIEAALGCGRFGLARALLAERTALRPDSPHTWKTYARALDGSGDAAGAAAARDRATDLMAA